MSSLSDINKDNKHQWNRYGNQRASEEERTLVIVEVGWKQQIHPEYSYNTSTKTSLKIRIHTCLQEEVQWLTRNDSSQSHAEGRQSQIRIVPHDAIAHDIHL